MLGWGGGKDGGGENEGPAPEDNRDWGSREPVRRRVGGGRTERCHDNWFPVALAARREGRIERGRRDRGQLTLGGGWGRGPQCVALTPL